MLEKSQNQFEREIKIKMHQLRRSKLFKKKIDKELEKVFTPEDASKYISQAGDISVAEKREKNLNAK